MRLSKKCEDRLPILAQNLTAHPQLTDALLSLNALLPPSSTRDENIERLVSGNAVAVVTGQQCGFLLGPLFTIYKLAAAIAVAAHLERELKIPAVPVFWIQSEDHDFEEIRTIFLPASTDPISLALPVTDSSPSSISVKDRIIDKSISESIDTLRQSLLSFPESAAFIELCATSYRPGQSICDAFRTLIAELSRDYGVVVFDPRDETARALHQAVGSTLFRRAIVNHAEITEQLTARTNEIVLSGGVAQVKIRENSPLCFFHPDGPHQARFRLQFEGNGFVIPETGGSYTTSELINYLENDSRYFSCSALLRPVFQDSIFPTAIYIGGTAELNYFKQLNPLYSHFAKTMPELLPRDSFVLLDERTQRQLKQLNITASEAMANPGQVLHLLASRDQTMATSTEHLFGTTVSNVMSAVLPLQEALRKTDKSLDTAFQRNITKFIELVSTLKPKYEEALLRGDKVRAERLEKIQNFINPQGIQQERFYSAAYFLGRYSTKLFDQLIEHISHSLRTAQAEGEILQELIL